MNEMLLHYGRYIILYCYVFGRFRRKKIHRALYYVLSILKRRRIIHVQKYNATIRLISQVKKKPSRNVRQVHTRRRFRWYTWSSLNGYCYFAKIQFSYFVRTFFLRPFSEWTGKNVLHKLYFKHFLKIVFTKCNKTTRINAIIIIT